MGTLFVGQNLIELASVSSTNTYAAELLQKMTVTEGTVVFTLNQSNGRGQRGNSWESEPTKNLTFSVILYPTFLPAKRQFDLNMAISCAIWECLYEQIQIPLFGQKLKVKWPNDIYVENKKIGGVLIENSLIGNQIASSIVGIGLNVNQEAFNPSVPNAISMKKLTQTSYNINNLLEHLCLYIEKYYVRLARIWKHQHQLENVDSIAYLATDYLKVLYRHNILSTYLYNGETIQAKLIGVSLDGKLNLQKEDFSVISCDFKEISFLI